MLLSTRSRTNLRQHLPDQFLAIEMFPLEDIITHCLVLFCNTLPQRYESEYLSNYKKFQSRRPNTVKGEVTRSLSYGSNSNGSTPRAGLQSSQLGTIHEPPLQRKRMVPYEKNHNIFTTVTVKEQPDREWLKTDGESYRSHSPPADRRHKEVLERDQ